MFFFSPPERRIKQVQLNVAGNQKLLDNYQKKEETPTPHKKSINTK